MVSENRFSKYLLYAVGEIILVVIGILIALQINTLHKEKQNKSLVQTSLENLREDLVIQKEIVQEQLDNEAQMLARVDSCSMFFDARISEAELSVLLANLTWRRTFVANKATFNNMGSTGDVVLIHDPELQNAIVRYYQELDYTTTVVNNNNLFLIDSHFGTFVFNNSLGFRLNEDGTPDVNHKMSPEDRFSLKSQLWGRRIASEANQRICNFQFKSTEKLIQIINEALKE